MENTIYVKFIDQNFKFRSALITLEGKQTYFPIYKQLEKLKFKPKRILLWKIMKGYTSSEYVKSKQTQVSKPTSNTKTIQLQLPWA